MHKKYVIVLVDVVVVVVHIMVLYSFSVLSLLPLQKGYYWVCKYVM